MKQFSIFLFLSIMAFQSFSQNKRADIRVENFSVLESGDKYEIQCTIRSIERKMDDKDYMLIGFIKIPSSPVEVVPIFLASSFKKNYYLPVKNEGDYSINFLPNRQAINRFVFYLVLVEGDMSRLTRVLTAGQDEFFKIEDILNFLDRANFTPLTYTSVSR